MAKFAQGCCVIRNSFGTLFWDYQLQPRHLLKRKEVSEQAYFDGPEAVHLMLLLHAGRVDGWVELRLTVIRQPKLSQPDGGSATTDAMITLPATSGGWRNQFAGETRTPPAQSAGRCSVQFLHHFRRCKPRQAQDELWSFMHAALT